MTIYQQVDTGSADDDGTGDTLRAAFAKVNANTALQDVAITMDESAAQADPGAAKGRLWVKDTAPTTLIFTDDTGVETELGAGGGGGTPGGADTQLQYNDGGAFAGDAFLTIDLTAGSGQNPTLTLDGTSGFYRRPILGFNVDANDEGGIYFYEEGVQKGYLQFFASTAGFTDVLHLNSTVNGGADTNSAVLISADNAVQILADERGTSIRRTLQLTEQASPNYADATGYGQLWVNNSGILYFRDEAGIDSNLTTREKSLNQPGELITIISTLRWYPTTDITLINITANVGVAATAANIVLDVKKNDISILASNITILATEFTAAPVVPTDTTLLTTDYLTVDILQIGLSLPGEDLVVNFKYQ